jgi:hypothetical protein
MAANPPDQEKLSTEEAQRQASIERGRAIAEAHAKKIGLGENASGSGAFFRYAVVLAVLAVAVAGGAYWLLKPGGLSDAEVRQQMIEESIAAYQASGSPCACPFNLMRDGRLCGEFSAYRQPGAAAPLCYPEDVADTAVRERRQRNIR